MKIKLLLVVLAIVSFNTIQAQTLPNGGFENWTSYPYDDPNPWFNSNLQCLKTFSVSNVTKVTGFSGFGVRMETKATATDTVFGYINYTPNDPTKDGGLPYSQQPTAINGYYRYNLPGNDTALLLVTFKKLGLVLSVDLFKIRGTGSQPTFIPFTYSLSVGSVPDTVIIASASSNALGNVGIQNGSFLELDQLSFSGPGITQPIPGGDFEMWTPKSVDVLQNWFTGGSAFTKSTSSYAGLYAASLGVVDNGGGNFDVAGMTNGVPTSSAIIGGTPYSSLNDTLTFYYKYTSPGLDTAGLNIGLKLNNTWIWGTNYKMLKTPTYTFVKIPLTPSIAPDSIVVFFTASEGNNSPHAVGNSNLWLDNLYYKSTLTGISEAALLNNETVVFPNPATNNINIRISAGISVEELQISIYDATGKEVFSQVKQNAHGIIPLDIENLSAGIYYYKLTGDNINLQSKFTKQ